MRKQKIAVARCLQHKAEPTGESAVYVPNALDQDQFDVETAPHLRVPNRVAMLYHTSAWREADENLRALHALKVEVREFEAELFGVPRRPAELPPWIKYHQDPPQAELRAICTGRLCFGHQAVQRNGVCRPWRRWRAGRPWSLPIMRGIGSSRWIGKLLCW